MRQVLELMLLLLIAIAVIGFLVYQGMLLGEQLELLWLMKT